jgi:hypothetical protein
MHPVEKKLQLEIVPYFISVRRLKNLWYYKVYLFYTYSHDLLAAIAAVGISHPILNSLNGSKNITAVQNSLDFGASWITGLVIICLVLWAYLKYFMVREDIEKKAILIKSCRRQFVSFEHELLHILNRDDPMPKLIELYDEFQPVIDRSIQEGIIEITDLLADEKTSRDSINRTNLLVSRHSSSWREIDNPNLRRSEN